MNLLDRGPELSVMDKTPVSEHKLHKAIAYYCTSCLSITISFSTTYTFIVKDSLFLGRRVIFLYVPEILKIFNSFLTGEGLF